MDTRDDDIRHMVEGVLREEAAKKLFISKDCEHYLARGNSQLVIRLDGRWVAKSGNLGEFEEAIRKVLFLKINPDNNLGHIVPGDFNNVFFGFRAVLVSRTSAEHEYEYRDEEEYRETYDDA